MTTDIQEPDENPLVIHAQRELTLAGLFKEDSDYSGDIGGNVLELVKVLSKQGNSGGSQEMTIAAFTQVANFRNLTPITDDPDEWYQHEEYLWQNRRNGAIFSGDAGKTYYDLHEEVTGTEQPVHNSEEYKCPTPEEQ